MSHQEVPQQLFTRRLFVRAVIKAMIAFALFIVGLVGIQPGRNGLFPTLYNHLIPGRMRFIKDYVVEPYSMIDDHIIARAQSETFNIVVLGSSEIWGLFTPPEKSVPTLMDRLDMVSADGRPVRVYNLSFPSTDSFKDLIMLEAVLRRHIPVDLVVLSLFDFSLGQGTPHVISTSNLLLTREVITHYHLAPFYSNSVSIADETSLRAIYGAESHILAAWSAMQLRGVIWMLTQDDIGQQSSRLRDEIQPVLTELFEPLRLKRAHPKPDILNAFSQLSQEAGIPVLILDTPLPVKESEFSLWLQDQTAAADLPLLDCWQALPDPSAFHDANHIRAETDVLYAHILANHLSDPRLAAESPGLPLHLPSNFVRPQEACTFYPSSKGGS